MPAGLRYGIVEFNLYRHCLDVIEWPSGAEVSEYHRSRIVLEAVADLEKN